MRDLMNNLSFESALAPGAPHTATVDGASIDVTSLNGGNDGLVFEVTAGTITDGTHAFKLQDTIDGGTTWVDVPAPYLQTPTGQTSQFTSSTTSGTTVKLGYLGNANVGTIANSNISTSGKILVRLVSTVTGATTGGYYSAVAVLGHAFELAAA